jgi:membrane-associated phospholipid phosphatase
VTAPSTSFPSGHALGVAVGVLALLTVVLPVVRRPLRAWLVALGALIVVTIGIGRVVLNVHYPSDVVAGWALGYAYFVACLLMVPPTRPVTVTDETPAALDTAR